ncbi:unnamed protein product [Microthlaspi erraticum]|uniref:Uncharacterized protein n=1 Tax=Microthlaspi erraticum TaxID=1685480 RepID=A0A6D2IGV3_9BRAS|nr:unnamed protein product [Microthlaspi erraticum]
MASTMPITSTCGENEQQPNRLHKRAPSLKIELVSVSNVNVAIPLLSPLAPSPTSSLDQSHVHPPQKKTGKPVVEEEEEKKTPVFRKWQHPAVPFCYDYAQAMFVQPFIPV